MVVELIPELFGVELGARLAVDVASTDGGGGCFAIDRVVDYVAALVVADIDGRLDVGAHGLVVEQRLGG